MADPRDRLHDLSDPLPAPPARAVAAASADPVTVAGTRVEWVLILSFGRPAALLAPTIYVLSVITGRTTRQRILHTRDQKVGDRRRPAA